MVQLSLSVVSRSRRRWSILLLVLVLLLLVGNSTAKPNQAKKTKANAATTDKEERSQAQGGRQNAQLQGKKPQQHKAQMKLQQQKQQKAKRETRASDATMEDTKENRQYHAARVMQGTPLIETLEGLVQEAARVKGPDAADAIRKSDTRALSQVMQNAYASTFTVDELAFIADYSNSEIGKRVQRKMSQYVAKVNPAMEAFTKEVFSGQAVQGESQQRGDRGSQWQHQQATHISEKGTTIIMNGEKAKQKKEREAAEAAAAAKGMGKGARSPANEL